MLRGHLENARVLRGHLENARVLRGLLHLEKARVLRGRLLHLKKVGRRTDKDDGGMQMPRRRRKVAVAPEGNHVQIWRHNRWSHMDTAGGSQGTGRRVGGPCGNKKFNIANF